MSNDRNRARWVGILFLVAAITAIAGLWLYGPLLNPSQDLRLSLTEQRQVVTGVWMEVLLVLSMVGIAILMFPVLGRHSKTLALGYVAFRYLESVMVMVGVVAVLAALTLSTLPAGLDPASLLVGKKALVAMHDWTFLLGPNTCLGVNTLLMSLTMHRMRLVPRFITVLGLVGGPLILLSSVLVMYGFYGQTSVPGGIAALPVFLYEMSLAVWLIVRGFGPPRQPAGQKAVAPARVS